MIKENFLHLMSKYSDQENYNLDCWNEIEKNYTSSSRHYHNLEHLEAMFKDLEKVVSHVENLDTLLFSIYYHDIIYKPTKNNNEHQSALLFKKRMSVTSFQLVPECMDQIEATKDHKVSTDNDTNILLDLDLTILGKNPKDYRNYSEAIRKEYQMYPDFIYRKGRKKVLKHLLELNPIFKTDFFKAEYENQAKVNIEGELKELG